MVIDRYLQILTVTELVVCVRSLEMITDYGQTFTINNRNIVGEASENIMQFVAYFCHSREAKSNVKFLTTNRRI